MAELILQETDPFASERALDEIRVPQRGSQLESWRAELDVYYEEMQKFEGMDPVEVFLRLSAFSARFSEIRSRVVRTENRRFISFRTQEIEPFLDECDRQFRIHSRIQSTRDLEFRLSGGHV